MKKVVIAGATGLVGKQLVVELAGHEGVETHILVRRKPARVPTGVIVHAAAAADWANMVAPMQADVVISCLGTTWKKSGRDEVAFRAVDYDLVTAVADAARTAGASHCISVSSVGAALGSSSFYLKTKGEMEGALTRLHFHRLDLLRPGLLTGERGVDRRVGERIGIVLSPLTDLFMRGSLSRYRSIPALVVAQAIANLALTGGQGKHIHENDAIRTLAG